MTSNSTQIEHENRENTTSSQHDHHLAISDETLDTNSDYSDISLIPQSAVSNESSPDRAATEYEEVRKRMLEVLHEKMEQTRLLDERLQASGSASVPTSNTRQAVMAVDAEHEWERSQIREMADRQLRHDEEMAGMVRDARESIETRKREFEMRREKRNEEARRQRAEAARIADEEREQAEERKRLRVQRLEKEREERQAAADLERERQRLQRAADRERASKRMEEDEEDHERRMEAVRNAGLFGFEGQRRMAAGTEMERLQQRINALEERQKQPGKKIRLQDDSSSNESGEED